MSAATLLLLAALLDQCLGDPPGWPHPVRWMGQGALWLEGMLRRPAETPGKARLAGVLAVLSLLGLTGLAGWILGTIASWLGWLLGTILFVIALGSCLAARDLVKHSQNVAQALLGHDLLEAQRRVGMIVGRDTDCLDEAGVIRATIESVAENCSDGIVAPIFWMTVGGLAGGPTGLLLGGLLFKAVSTLDSTFGYKNDRYRNFGWAAARLDDLANLIPARLTALTMIALSPVVGGRIFPTWRVWRRDHAKHPSPNSAQSEAALAGALGIELGGPVTYGGVVKHRETLGNPEWPLNIGQIDRANRLVFATEVAVLLLAWALL